MENLTGRHIKNYELKERIGAGGFGEVYLAHQHVIDREVAIKVILPRYANGANFIRRFEAEAQLVARLEHPHIVPLFDYWREPDGAYLVMRYLRGGSLRDRLRSGPMHALVVAAILEQISSALILAHRSHVIHRDIKPGNILLDEDQNAYLTDFGIAKGLENVEETAAGQITGSPAYLSPEQVRGDPVVPQSDIYSLGIVTYELLTAEHPFKLTEIDDLRSTTIMLKHLTDAIPDLHDTRPDLPDTVNAALQKATAKDPAERFSNVVAFATAFRNALTPEALPGLDALFEMAQGQQQPPVGDFDEHTLTRVEAGLAIENPYKGLRAFEQGDAADFFGRKVLVEKLVERLRGDDEQPPTRFLSIIGPSGSGKSSLVKAGLIPALRSGAVEDSDQWFYVETTPGDHPFEQLETALLSVAVSPPENIWDELRDHPSELFRIVNILLPEETKLFLLIDQFEETFTLVEDEDERTSFLQSLISAVEADDSRVLIAITLRADFFDRPLLYPAFGELVRTTTEVVLPLNDEEMRLAITGPAQRVGLNIEPELVSELIVELHEQPGVLPFLQYALTEIFEYREGVRLTLQAYHEMGGALQALARRAEDAYCQLDEAKQTTARQLFLRLITLGERAEDSRRRVLLATLPRSSNTMQHIIDYFSRHRLLTFDYDPSTRQPTVEIAHEALIRSWTRLRNWLDASREGLRTQRQLARASVEWINAERDQSFLASGRRLDQFETWQAHTDLALNENETDYLQASLQKRKQAQAAEAARLAREQALEHRSRRLLQGLVGVFFTAAVVAVILAVLAAVGQQDANRSAKTATVAQGQAAQEMYNAQTQAAAATQAEGQAIEAARAESTSAAIARQNAAEAQSLALAASAQLALENHDRDLAIALALEANSMDNPPPESQRILAVAAQSPGTRLVLPGHDDLVTSVAFSSDNSRAVSASMDGTVIIWNISGGNQIARYNVDPAGVLSVQFSPNGETLLVGSPGGSLRLLQTATGDVIREFEGHQGDVTSVAFSPGGRYALSGSFDGTARLWEIADGTQLRRYEGHQDAVSSVLFSNNGLYAVTGSADGSVRLWDLNTTEQLRRFSGHTNWVLGIAISPNNTMIASASFDGTVRLWDVQTQTEIGRLVGHTDFVYSVAFSPDGRTILSASFDTTLRLWDVRTGVELRRFSGHEDRLDTVAFSPDGRMAISGDFMGSIRVWDVDSGAILRRLSGHEDVVVGVAFAHNDQYVLSASLDGTLRLWDTGTGATLIIYEGHNGAITDVATQLCCQIAVSSSEDDTLIVWDIERGEIIHHLEGHDDVVQTVAMSSDGRQAISGGFDNQVIVWDLLLGREVRRLEGHANWVVSSAISPDGSQSASGDFDNLIIVWDMETGEQLHRLEGHNAPALALAFSPDGSHLLSGSIDNTLRLWNLETGELLQVFDGHSDRVYSVAFSPDGETVLSASQDGRLIIWDIMTGQMLWQFEGHDGAVHRAIFSPDGSRVVSASADSTVIVWQVDHHLDELTAWTYANRYVRDLTCAERELYRVEPICSEAGVYPTRTPYPTAVPTNTPTSTPTVDFTQTTPTPGSAPTMQPTLTPTLPAFDAAFVPSG